MKTESVLLQNLCVPCACRCRYCLLSWDGRPVGVPWERGARFALRFGERMRVERPELRFDFSFGYAMEHPALREALRFLRRIGSPQAEYLQCDGLRMRGEAECEALAALLAKEGVRRVNFTFYGTEAYHDRFAAREGDFALLLRLMRAADAAGLSVSAGVALTAENAAQTDELLGVLRGAAAGVRPFLFIPHGEGRGATLQSVRFSERDFEALSPEARALLNRERFRPEREWVSGGAYREERARMLLLSLRADNIDRYETMTPAALIAEAEALDDAYYAAFPPFAALAARCGDPQGGLFYRQRDLFARYRSLYARETGAAPYDVTDERQTGSRRY